MPENLRKASLYFRNSQAYWQVTDQNQVLAVNPGVLGRYPLNLEPRLTSGHYTYFDGAGLPLRASSDGRGFIHNYSTLSGFALGYWDRYLRFRAQSDLGKLVAVADYMIETAHAEDGTIVLRNDDVSARHAGNPSALTQGQALSVLCRAWQATNQPKYLETAYRLVPLFDLPIERGGIVGRITSAGVPWFEEYVERPVNHVLNGMLIAILGLRDLALIAGHQSAIERFQCGVDSVVAALPSFDNGFWSWYGISESGPSYIASMGYHMLHVHLLSALGAHTGKAELIRHADRFESYARRPVNRCRAVFRMVGAKAEKTTKRLLARASGVRTRP